MLPFTFVSFLCEYISDLNLLYLIFTDERDCYDCEEVLSELERIDDEADELDIMFVKIRDMRYARKYGISQVPALVYFRKKFPAIYRGN